MNEHASARPAATSGRPRFDERLVAPWWAYLMALAMAMLVGTSVHLGYTGVRSWIGYAVTPLLFLGAVVWWSRTRVRVDDTTLRAGPATLSLAHVGSVDTVTEGGEPRRLALGPELDPAAHRVVRPWVRALVRVEVTDPDDPTPYWVISSRRPDDLARALRR